MDVKKKDRALSSESNLLEIIRGKPFQPAKSNTDEENDWQDSGTAEIIEAGMQKRSRFSLALFRSKGKTDVGIWTDDRFISVVALRNDSENKKTVTQWWIEEISYSADGWGGIPPSAAEKIRQICGKSVSKIWLTGLFERIDVRFLELPKVSEKIMDSAVLAAFFKNDSRNKKEKALLNNFDKKKMIFDFQQIPSLDAPADDKFCVAAYTAYREDAEKIQKKIFQAGASLSGISFLAFSLQNLIRSGLLSTGNKHLCTLYIGMDYSTIDIFFPDGGVGVSRRIKTCVNSMIRAVESSIFAPAEAEFSVSASKENAYDFEPPPESGDNEREDFFWRKIQDADIFRKESGTALVEVFERLIWQVERTVDYFHEKVGTINVEKMIVLGKTSGCSTVIDYFNQRMELSVGVLNLDQLVGPLSFSPEAEEPAEDFKQSLIVLGIGSALSTSGITSNLLMPRDEQVYQEKIQKVNKFLLAVFIIVLCSCFIYHYKQRVRIDQYETEIAQLNNKYETMIENDGTYVSQQLIEQQMTLIEEVNSQLTPIVSKKTPLAIISEIVHPLPKRIKLLRFQLLFEKNEKDVSKDKKRYRVEVEGVVSGEPLFQEGKVLEYVDLLEEKELFFNVEIKKKSRGVFQKDDVLRFVLQCETANG